MFASRGGRCQDGGSTHDPTAHLSLETRRGTDSAGGSCLGCSAALGEGGTCGWRPRRMRWDVDWSTGSLRAPRSVAKQRRRWIPCFTGWFLFLIMAALCCLAHYPDVPFTRRILPPHYKWLNTDGAQVLTHPFAEWEVLTHPFIQDAEISREELAQYDLGRRNVTTEAEAQQPLSYGIDRGSGWRVCASVYMFARLSVERHRRGGPLRRGSSWGWLHYKHPDRHYWMVKGPERIFSCSMRYPTFRRGRV
jgi:hypothetical protein